MSLLVDIGTLDYGSHELEVAAAPEDLDLDPESFSAIRVALNVDVGEQRISMSMSAEAIATLTCDRTLVRFNEHVSGTYFVIYEREAKSNADADESGELRHLPSTELSVDIAPDVRDTLLLAVPLRKVAPEADAVDLDLSYGSPDESDVDPRWKALEALRSKQ